MIYASLSRKNVFNVDGRMRILPSKSSERAVVLLKRSYLDVLATTRATSKIEGACLLIDLSRNWWTMVTDYNHNRIRSWVVKIAIVAA